MLHCRRRPDRDPTIGHDAVRRFDLRAHRSLNIVFRSSGVLNFGAGYLAAVAGIFYAIEISGSVIGVELAMVLTAVVSLLADFVAVRGGERLGVGRVQLLLSLLGFGLVLQFAAGELSAKQGFTARSLIAGTLNVAGATFVMQCVVVVAVAAAGIFVLAIVLFVERTMIEHAIAPNRPSLRREGSRGHGHGQPRDDEDLEGMTQDLLVPSGKHRSLRYAIMKQLIHRAVTTDLDTGLLQERLCVEKCATTSHDAREGLHAFLERRPSRFTGV